MRTTFPNHLKSDILTAIDQYIKSHPGPHYAAFDADGTLWDSDIGEIFFQYQIDHCDLPILKKIADPWKHYKDLKAQYPPKGYLWLAQINANQKISTVETWSRKAAQADPPKLFPQQVDLINELQKRDISIFVVSASIQWAVVGAIKQAGFQSIEALGVKTKIKDDIVTDEQDGAVTWQEGKAKALLERTQGIKPVFCSGNTNGDIHLLNLSQTTPLCVQTQNTPGRLFDEESKLLAVAKQKAWHIHAFC